MEKENKKEKNSHKELKTNFKNKSKEV